MLVSGGRKLFSGFWISGNNLMILHTVIAKLKEASKKTIALMFDGLNDR